MPGRAYIKSKSAGQPVVADTYVHAAGVTEQDALVSDASTRRVSVRFDMIGFAQDVIVREYERIDGVNYREVSYKTFPTDFDTGCEAVYIEFIQANADYRVTFQSVVSEGVAISVPYRYVTQSLSVV